MNASEIILEAKSSRFDFQNLKVAFLMNKAVANLLSNKESNLSYVENALIFMPSLLPICLGLTIWVSPRLRGSV